MICDHRGILRWMTSHGHMESRPPTAKINILWREFSYEMVSRKHTLVMLCSSVSSLTIFVAAVVFYLLLRCTDSSYPSIREECSSGSIFSQVSYRLRCQTSYGLIAGDYWVVCDCGWHPTIWRHESHPSSANICYGLA